MAINLYGYSTQRISGLSSGMDTQTIVNNLMATQQLKLDKLFRQKEKAQWKLDAYTELNAAVSSLRNSYLSVLGDKSLTKSSAYNAYKVSMEANSAVKVTGMASALPSSFKILETVKATAASITSASDTRQTEIKGVASQFMKATVTGAIVLAEGKALSRDTSIEDLADEFGLKNGDNLSFSINGETFTFNRADTLGRVIDDIAASEKANVTVEFTHDANTGSITFTSNIAGPGSKIELSNITGTAFATDAGFGATNAQVQKKALVTAGEINAPGSALTFSQAVERVGVALGGTDFQINGFAFSLLENGVEKSIQDVMDEVNRSDAGVALSYDENNATFVLRNKAESAKAAIEVNGALFGENSVFGVEEGRHTASGAIQRSDTLAEAARKMGSAPAQRDLTVTINGKEFTFDTHTATLSDMMYAINQDKDIKAAFSYSELTDSFQLAGTETGGAATLSFAGLELFGLTDPGDLQGRDAMLRVESQGTTSVITQASNSFTLDGLAFEITGDKVFGAEGLSVSVERDFEPTINAIKDFVEEYNKVVGALTTKYYEKDYSRSYPPLTEDERGALTEAEAAKWDEKAKSGVLRNDSAVGALLTNMRSALSAKVGDTGWSAMDLGISTVAWASSTWRTEQGKLTLDEDKLLAALKENPNAVQQVLTRVSTNDKGLTDTGVTIENGVATAGSGLLTRMGSFLSSFNTAMSTRNILDTQKSINGYTEKMADMLQNMAKKEESYWAKYSKMETMLSEMQSQQNWLAAQLGLASNNQ